MKRIGCFALLLCLMLGSGNTIHGQESPQQVPAAVTSDPPPDPAYPATMEWPDILSHASKMYSVLYIASGSGPHPTVLMLHGFPGNEKNLDLAYSIRRAGWNVLLPFYRGAWGSGGTFSFTHALEDAQASIDFLRDSENVKKFRIDPARIVLVGHSMGGFVAAYAAAHEPNVFAVALVSPGNLGPGSARQRTNDPQFWDRWTDNASRLVGTTAQQLVQEVDSDPIKWNYMNCVSLLNNRPVLILEADDRNTSDNQELASRLQKAGDARVTEIHMHTDHPFSDHRIAMQAAIVNWLGIITKPQLASQTPKEQAVDELSSVRAQSVGLQRKQQSNHSLERTRRRDSGAKEPLRRRSTQRTPKFGYRQRAKCCEDMQQSKRNWRFPPIRLADFVLKSKTSASSTRSSLSLTRSTTAPRSNLVVMPSTSWSNVAVSGSFVRHALLVLYPRRDSLVCIAG